MPISLQASSLKPQVPRQDSSLEAQAFLSPALGWFASRGWRPFDYQVETWQAYREGASGLVHAPTGMGKTYAVWMGPLLEALSKGADQSSELISRGLKVLWITPLRALANDIAGALQAPLTDLNSPWTVEVRTGDTSQSVRKRQRERLPSALVTTPESLSLILSYPDSGGRLAGLRCVVVDEWHELMGTKRGVQTELGLGRLRSIAPGVRTWGLSATIGNLDEATRVLMGGGNQETGDRSQETEKRAGHSGSCLLTPGLSSRLIQGPAARPVSIVTLLPECVARFPWAGHMGLNLLPAVLDRLAQARTTLLFTNTRSQAEVWFQHILRARPEWLGEITVHHGSIDRELRGRVEAMARAGTARCVVCTSSLDLGVDFAPVDQVIQIGSPKGIARLLQRAGRSGHQPGKVSRIYGVPTHALELVEYSAARDAISDGRQDACITREEAGSDTDAPAQIEARVPLRQSLDVLVQHLVTVALGGGFREAELFEEVRRTHAFAEVTPEQWAWAMDFVTRGGPTLRAYPRYMRVAERDGLYVVPDARVGRLHRMSIGTITSDDSLRVKVVRGATLGTIEESFIARLRPGDRFVFSGRVLELVRVRDMTAWVRRTTKAAGVVPRWQGGRMPLSSQLAAAVRHKLTEFNAGIIRNPEMEAIAPLLELQRKWSRIPAEDELLVEQTRTREGHHTFVHSFEGRLVHEGLAALVAFRLTRQSPRSVSVSGNDYGFELLSPEPIVADDLFWRQLTDTTELLSDLLACVNKTEMARRQFRDIARIAGLVFQGYPGAGKSARQLQASSELFYDVFLEFDPANLLLDQARREVLEQQLEFLRLKNAMERMGRCRRVLVECERLTPLAFPIWADRLRSQHVTSEKWSERIQRMAVRLEKAASAPAKKRRSRADRVGR